jgi:hypothetical protein
VDLLEAVEEGGEESSVPPVVAAFLVGATAWMNGWYDSVKLDRLCPGIEATFKYCKGLNQGGIYTNAHLCSGVKRLQELSTPYLSDCRKTFRLVSGKKLLTVSLKTEAKGRCCHSSFLAQAIAMPRHKQIVVKD